MLKYVPVTTTPRVQTEWVALSETTAMHASTDFNTVGKVTDTSFHNKDLHVRVDRAGCLVFDIVYSL